ncbi:hypothetical protein H0E87_020380 [Populus deltoides]|uniref:Uncharacterized protein n=1 Tax=Populus deltoides TaxID=3696 RepID=A0A8T2XJ72_POPDE|nr:hypothetical protein H0E87_020380 [Populus deltoides]
MADQLCAHVRRGLWAMTPISLISGSLVRGGYGDGDPRILYKSMGECAEIVVVLIMLYGHLIGGSEPERSTATSTTMGCMCKAPSLTLEKFCPVSSRSAIGASGAGKVGSTQILYEKRNGDAVLVTPQEFGVDPTQEYSHTA